MKTPPESDENDSDDSDDGPPRSKQPRIEAVIEEEMEEEVCSQVDMI